MITNVPHISRKEALLSTRELIQNPIEVFESFRRKSGETFSFYFGGVKKTIVTTDPGFIQYILKDHHENYHKSDIQVKRMAEFQGLGLLNSHGDYWFKQRRLLSSGFTRSSLSRLMPIQNKLIEEFVTNFDKQVKKEPIDIYETMVRFTLLSVGSNLFGTQLKHAELEKLGSTISTIQEFIVKQIFRPYLISWYRISGEKKKLQILRREADQIIIDYINTRRLKENDSTNDFLDILLNKTSLDSEESMSEKQLQIEMLQLLVAGNETSSNALTWMFYELAKNATYRELISAEVLTIFGDKEIDFQGLSKLTFTMQVLKETLRLYPPFWMIDRVALNEDEFNGVKIPQDTIVVPYIYGAQRRADLWQSPDKFDPDRFLKSNAQNIHPFAYIPFGGGPRVCIGQNMAYMQILSLLVTIVRKYDFNLVSENVGIHPMMILRPDGPIKIKFERL